MGFKKGNTLTPKNTPSDIWKRIDIREDNECWEWRGHTNNKGYGCITINYKHWYVHRVAYEETYGTIPNKLFVLHKCDNPKCCNPEHLFLGTQKDNMKDMTQKHRSIHHTKISDSQVEEIRNLYSTGNYTQEELGKKFGVHRVHVGNLIVKKYRRNI